MTSNPAAASDTGTKPTPNDGAPTGTKTWYVSERIHLAPEVVPNLGFENDRGRLWDQPGFHIFGKCPSCGHYTTAVCATEYLAQDVSSSISNNGVKRSERFMRPVPGTPTAPARVPFPGVPSKQITIVQCACTSNHVGPAASFGCGSEWLLRVDFPQNVRAPATITGVSAEDAVHCWPAADAAAAAVPTSLTTAQTAATKWQAALAAIITLLGVSALLGSRTTIQTFSTGPKFCFGIVAFIAVAATVYMLYQSDLASFGSLRIKKSLNPLDLEDANLTPLIQASAAVGRLQRSVWAAGVAVVAALVAAGILLFVGAASPPAVAPATSKITYKTNAILTTTPCGTLASGPAAAPGEPAAAALTITPTGGSPETIQVKDIQAIVAC